MCEWEVFFLYEFGNFKCINFIIFGFISMNGFYVKCMVKNKVNIVFFIKIRYLILVVYVFNINNNIV